MNVLVVDNYDSFTYILVQYLGELGAHPIVRLNDDPELWALAEMEQNCVLVSPGPGVPKNAGCSVEIIRQLSGKIPILGVCLGHQAIAEAFGGRTIRAEQPMHGKTSSVVHDETGIFAGVPSPAEFMRYHSLVVDSEMVPPELEVTARSGGGGGGGGADGDVFEIMAIRHRLHPTFGVQFHPESVGSEYGKKLIANFLGIAAQKTGISGTTFDTAPVSD